MSLAYNRESIGSHMSPSSPPPLTSLLRQWTEGDPEVVDRVVPLLYQELRRIAARELRRERSEHTLQATALVSEAYLRLRDVHGVTWQNRSQFLAFAAHLIRRILVEHARRRRLGQARRRRPAGHAHRGQEAGRPAGPTCWRWTSP